MPTGNNQSQMTTGNKRRLGRAGLVILAVIFLAGVTLTSLLPSARLDLTSNHLYTLSTGTRNIVGHIPEPLNVYLYFSDKATTDVPQLRTYAGRVREMLTEFASLSNGKLKLTIIDPLPFSEEEDRATSFGLRPINLGNNADPIYFGIAATNSVGDQQIIPFLDPNRESFLEYDLAKLVYTLAHPKKPVVGLLSDLPMTAGFDPMTQQVRPAWVVAEQVRQLFDLKILQPDLAGLNAPAETALTNSGKDADSRDVQVLMLVHPKKLSDEALYAIDQFVLHGGRALIFVDPYSEIDSSDPMSGAAAGDDGKASSLNKLFKAWGISMDPGTIVGDDRYALTVSGTNGQPVRHLGIIGVDQTGLDQDDVITNGLNAINLAFAGHIVQTGDSKPHDATKRGDLPTFTPLIRSSDKAGLIPTNQIMLASDPTALRTDFAPTGERYTLAARIAGKLKSAFPGDQRPGHLDTAATSVNVVVVADTDLLADRLWVQTQNILGQHLNTAFANNGDLVINALDNLLGSSDLIGIRSRATFQRPFTRVQDLRRAAEARFRTAEKRLQSELDETESRLGELQASRTDQGATILSPQQQAEIDRFQVRRLELRKELRQVQRNSTRISNG
ncbi:MAG: Gldg family protein [Gammaproteobacteria bacterium]